MRQNELRATWLAARLRVGGIDARVKGGGVHWQVAVTSTTDRSAKVHCFWQGRGVSTLMLLSLIHI